MDPAHLQPGPSKKQAVIQVSQSREEFEGKEADLSAAMGIEIGITEASPKSKLLQCEAP